MRRFLLILPLLLFIPLSALAQGGTPKLEVFGGYSNLSANVNASSLNMNGFDVSVAENLNSWFGGALDFSTHFGTQDIGTATSLSGAVTEHATVNTESLTYGPVFSYRKNPRVTPFGHVLLGAARGGPDYLDISKSEFRFAMYAGGGVDLKVAPNVSLRLIQADYLMTRFSNAGQDNFRLSAGVVFRFGSK